LPQKLATSQFLAIGHLKSERSWSLLYDKRDLPPVVCEGVASSNATSSVVRVPLMSEKYRKHRLLPSWKFHLEQSSAGSARRRWTCPLGHGTGQGRSGAARVTIVGKRLSLLFVNPAGDEECVQLQLRFGGLDGTNGALFVHPQVPVICTSSGPFARPAVARGPGATSVGVSWVVSAVVDVVLIGDVGALKDALFQLGIVAVVHLKSIQTRNCRIVRS